MKKLKKIKLARKSLKKLPENPGVYIFWQKSNPLYVGKAINLKNRVSSYLALNLAAKTKQMVNEADILSFIQVTSELEALLLEAKLIKKYQTKYNSELRDDKHPLYIRITDEDYPRVLTARKDISKEKNRAFFGPFPASTNVWTVLKMLRRIFPYSDHKLAKRGCLYSQIGLCNPCPSEIERIKGKKEKALNKKEYMKNIYYIKAVLSGRIKGVRKALEKDMTHYSSAKEYEKAALLRDQIAKLDYITQPITPIERFEENPNLIEDIRKEELDQLKLILEKGFPQLKNLRRIDCFDVAHLAGTSPTASMVTFIDGVADKSLYRHFRIRQKKGADDVSSLGEVAKRRKKYLKKWGKPNLVIVDGGKGQVNTFLKYLAQTKIPIIGLAKREEKLIIPQKTGDFTQIRLSKGPALYLVQRLRDEAHRFARRYHHHLLKKSLLKGS